LNIQTAGNTLNACYRRRPEKQAVRGLLTSTSIHGSCHRNKPQHAPSDLVSHVTRLPCLREFVNWFRFDLWGFKVTITQRAVVLLLVFFLFFYLVAIFLSFFPDLSVLSCGSHEDSALGRLACTLLGESHSIMGGRLF